jgi:hypothetical protein
VIWPGIPLGFPKYDLTVDINILPSSLAFSIVVLIIPGACEEAVKIRGKAVELWLAYRR